MIAIIQLVNRVTKKMIQINGFRVLFLINKHSYLSTVAGILLLKLFFEGVVLIVSDVTHFEAKTRKVFTPLENCSTVLTIIISDSVTFQNQISFECCVYFFSNLLDVSKNKIILEQGIRRFIKISFSEILFQLLTECLKSCYQ